MKFLNDNAHVATNLSLLSWERGLKYHRKAAQQRRTVVAPLVGAWIEICSMIANTRAYGSLLSWERGLKLPDDSISETGETVAPLVGAWIEILNIRRSAEWGNVAPLVGAWIEINGLDDNWYNSNVAPLVGAWIEIHHNGSAIFT